MKGLALIMLALAVCNCFDPMKVFSEQLKLIEKAEFGHMEDSDETKQSTALALGDEDEIEDQLEEQDEDITEAQEEIDESLEEKEEFIQRNTIKTKTMIKDSDEVSIEQLAIIGDEDEVEDKQEDEEESAEDQAESVEDTQEDQTEFLQKRKEKSSKVKTLKKKNKTCSCCGCDSCKCDCDCDS